MTVPRVVTRHVDGSVHALTLPDGPVAVFPLPGGVEPAGHSAAPDLGRLAYTVDDALVCLDADGRELWRVDFGPAGTKRFAARPDCAFSLDGGVVWLYRPDAMSKRGDTDRWVVVDAATGAVLAEADLGSEGHGGSHFPHPDGVHVLLDVGEGQDGARVYRGRFEGGAVELDPYPWADRCLVDLAPGGDGFMTVDHEQGDVAFHAYPGGEVLARTTAEPFRTGPGHVCFEYAGGYLDDGTALVAVIVYDEDTDDEEFAHHLVDVRTGEARGRLETGARDAGDVRPVGGGSWLTTDDDGRFTRRSRITATP
ncbi:hypothetical protein [Saccharothrix sp. Mg75]|uniref:hypothetical protein n=1 Tax=Saccharothrix sp. Mg75 TaxID=3445357 RepID=UPI003EEA9686